MSNFRNKKVDFGDFLKKASENPNETKSESEVNDFINKNLTAEQANEVKNILGDKEKMEKMLSGSDAKKLFKELFGGKI